jgi:hypothetical protein
MAESPLEYYTQPTAMSDAGAYADQLNSLPSEIPVLCEVVQGLLIHRDWAPLYGVTLATERKPELQIRPVREMLARIFALDDQPLTVARPPERRLFGVCSHFALLLCSILRHRGVPARSRCGFGAYFRPGSFEDHYVCEYWNAAESRWVLVDAQLDAQQRQVLKPDFSTLDIPHDRFVIAGDAWQWCRSGRADPRRFGIWDMRGTWFVRGNVIHDVAGLNHVELLPWDGWGPLMRGPEDEAKSGEAELAFVDRIAALSVAGDGAFAEIRAAYQGDDRLRVPRVITSFTEQGPQTVTVET